MVATAAAFGSRHRESAIWPFCNSKCKRSSFSLIRKEFHYYLTLCNRQNSSPAAGAGLVHCLFIGHKKHRKPPNFATSYACVHRKTHNHHRIRSLDHLPHEFAAFRIAGITCNCSKHVSSRKPIRYANGRASLSSAPAH